LLQLLAPDAVVGADEAAVLAGTPASIEGRDEVATFFNGSAQSAFAVLVGDRPASAWFLRGEAKVVFDFTIDGGQVHGITFRAEPAVLAQVVRRSGADPA
ncbi:MAG: RNA polymerase subunit sigma-70, partial [Nocardioides sp.]